MGAIMQDFQAELASRLNDLYCRLSELENLRLQIEDAERCHRAVIAPPPLALFRRQARKEPALR
jgi:hypothetical protein